MEGNGLIVVFAINFDCRVNRKYVKITLRHMLFENCEWYGSHHRYKLWHFLLIWNALLAPSMSTPGNNFNVLSILSHWPKQFLNWMGTIKSWNGFSWMNINAIQNCFGSESAMYSVSYKNRTCIPFCH